MTHLLCTDQPQGRIAAWTQHSLRLRGESCRVVAYAAALEVVTQPGFDAVVIDLDRLNAPSLSLLTQLWKIQSSAPVWLASRHGGRSEQLLRRFASPCTGRSKRSARHDGVYLTPMSKISATSLMALRQWLAA